MSLFTRRFDVLPGEAGVLFRDHRRERVLAPGVVRVFDPGRRVSVYTVTTAPVALSVQQQEALTQDAVAFRLSYTVRYEVADAERALASVPLSEDAGGMAFVYGRVRREGARSVDAGVQMLVHAYVQAAVKDRLGALTSEQITADRALLADVQTPELDTRAAAVGVRIVEVVLRDVSFPRAVQHLFAKRLEARIRAESDLENARTTVAAARALKNASAMLRDDPGVLFLQYLETLGRIADKGSHTFHVEGAPRLPSRASADGT